MLFEFPHFFDNKVINGFRRHIVQAFIIQQIFLRHAADMHGKEPIINDIIAGNIPKIVIPTLASFMVAESGMQTFMARTNFHSSSVRQHDGLVYISPCTASTAAMCISYLRHKSMSSIILKDEARPPRSG